MTSQDELESMAARFNRDRPIPAVAPRPPAPAKPKGGARLLSFLLQAAVMAVALSLFFLFAGVAALLLLHLCVAGRAFRRRRRRLHARIRSPPDQYPPSGSSPGLSPDNLKNLSAFRSGRRDPPEDCPVCLEGFREGDWCRNLPGCGHCFHVACVDRWLVRSPACPICRREVVVAPVVIDQVGWRMAAMSTTRG